MVVSGRYYPEGEWIGEAQRTAGTLGFANFVRNGSNFPGASSDFSAILS